MLLVLDIKILEREDNDVKLPNISMDMPPFSYAFSVCFTDN